MAYTPRNWVNGEKPTADVLVKAFNDIEQGIADIETTTQNAVNSVNAYLAQETGKYVSLDGSKPMTGNLAMGGYTALQLGNTSLARASAAPSALTLNVPAGANVYANGSPVWTDTRTGFAMYYAELSPSGSAGYQSIYRLSGYDCAGNAKGSGQIASGNRVTLADAGTYMLVFNGTAASGTDASASIQIMCGSYQSPKYNLFKSNFPGQYPIGITWTCTGSVSAGSQAGVYVNGYVDFRGDSRLTIVRVF